MGTRYDEKMFLVLAFVALFFPVIASKNVYAQDVWVSGESNYNVYAMTETYERYGMANFSIFAKLVYPNGTYATNKYEFTREQQGRFNVTWCCKVNDNSIYTLNLDEPKANTYPYLVSLFRFCVQKFQS